MMKSIEIIRVQNFVSFYENKSLTEKNGLLVIKFLGRYDPAWVDEMKTYGSCYYDWKAREWLLRWSKLSCDSLADYFGSRGIKVNVVRPVIEKELASQRKETFDDIRCKELGTEALDGLDSLEMYLDENRYSPKTRESYISMLDFFFRYFSPKKPLEITDNDISKFIYDFIIRLGYSPAYQNQMVSAIKTYYLISGKEDINEEQYESARMAFEYAARERDSILEEAEFHGFYISFMMLLSINYAYGDLIEDGIGRCGFLKSEYYATNVEIPTDSRIRDWLDGKLEGESESYQT